MACNCGKKTTPRRTTVIPRPARVVASQNVRNDQVQAQSLPPLTGLNADRRNAERQRRAAIFKKLGRI